MVKLFYVSWWSKHEILFNPKNKFWKSSQRKMLLASISGWYKVMDGQTWPHKAVYVLWCARVQVGRYSSNALGLYLVGTQHEHGQVTNCPDWGLLWFFSVSSGNAR
jgi:hypothetical protein